MGKQSKIAVNTLAIIVHTEDEVAVICPKTQLIELHSPFCNVLQNPLAFLIY